MKYHLTEEGVGFLNELSPELLKRAAEKAKLHSKFGRFVGRAHALMARHKRESDPLDPETKRMALGPHGQVTALAGTYGQERAQQAQKFTAASKGVRSRRPARGYPLGILGQEVLRRTRALGGDFQK